MILDERDIYLRIELFLYSNEKCMLCEIIGATFKDERIFRRLRAAIFII